MKKRVVWLALVLIMVLTSAGTLHAQGIGGSDPGIRPIPPIIGNSIPIDFDTSLISYQSLTDFQDELQTKA